MKKKKNQSFWVVQIKYYNFENINLIPTLLKKYQIKTYSQNWVTPL